MAEPLGIPSEALGVLSEALGSPSEPPGHSAEPSGQFAEPSGQFAEPPGQFAEPPGLPSEPSGQFAEPPGSPSEPSGQLAEPSGEPSEPSGQLAEPLGSLSEPLGRQFWPLGSPFEALGSLSEPLGRLPEGARLREEGCHALYGYTHSMADTPPGQTGASADEGSASLVELDGHPLQDNSLFRLLVAGVTDYAIFMLDPAGHVLTWNAGAERLKGYSAEEARGLHFSAFYRQEDIERGWPRHELKVAAEKGRFEDEGWRVRKDGSLFWANVIITALYDQGRLYGFSKVTRDLTERRQAEEELRQARDRLEERVQERTAEIEHLAQMLKTADRRKNEFLATLAHELRNPLAPILNAVQLLHLAEDDPAIRQQAEKVIGRQVGQMVRLIDDLLDVSRITNDKLQLRTERIELAAPIHSALETARPLIDKAGHELTVSLPPDPVFVDADPTRLAQVFTNLLNNAAKYTEDGGHIRLTVERQGSEVLVSIRDTGIGIAAEHLPHLFEMFSQVVPGLERSGGGLGLGLALAQGVVRMHGGSIEARSEGLGKGSELLVRLPVAEAPAQAQPQTSSTESEEGPRWRVLVADDNQDSADGLSLLLSLTGYEVWTAYDGVEAVHAAATHHPDVALLDIGMPKLNGYEVAHRIREQPWGRNMLLVAITGWGQDDDKQRALEAGFDHHLTKPVVLTDLKHLLARKAAAGRSGPWGPRQPELRPSRPAAS